MIDRVDRVYIASCGAKWPQAGKMTFEKMHLRLYHYKIVVISEDTEKTWFNLAEYQDYKKHYLKFI